MSNVRNSLAWKSMVERRAKAFDKLGAGEKPVTMSDIFIERRELKPRSGKKKTAEAEEESSGIAEFKVHVREDVLEKMGVPEDKVRRMRTPIMSRGFESPYRLTGEINLQMVDVAKEKEKMKTASSQSAAVIKSKLETLQEEYGIDLDKNPKVIMIRRFYPLEDIGKRTVGKVLRRGIGEQTYKKITQLAKTLGADYVTLWTEKDKMTGMVNKPSIGLEKVFIVPKRGKWDDTQPLGYYRGDLKKKKK